MSSHNCPECDEGSYSKLFREVREVGQGAHGRVLLVEQISSGARYVLKLIPLSQLPGGVAAALPEVEVLCRLAHTNITKLFGAWRTRDTLNILMEYADGGTLADVIKARSGLTRVFDEDTVLDWFVQITSALVHMHERSIIHRDLKAHNIFLTSRNIVKVGDFGISKVLDGTAALATTAVGTPYYLAPEVINGDPYGLKADVWALGVLLFELVALRKPFAADSLPALAMLIMRAQYPPPPASFSDELRGLLVSMLQVVANTGTAAARPAQRSHDPWWQRNLLKAFFDLPGKPVTERGRCLVPRSVSPSGDLVSLRLPAILSYGGITSGCKHSCARSH